MSRGENILYDSPFKIRKRSFSEFRKEEKKFPEKVSQVTCIKNEVFFKTQKGLLKKEEGSPYGKEKILKHLPSFDLDNISISSSGIAWEDEEGIKGRFFNEPEKDYTWPHTFPGEVLELFLSDDAIYCFCTVTYDNTRTQVFRGRKGRAVWEAVDTYSSDGHFAFKNKGNYAFVLYTKKGEEKGTKESSFFTITRGGLGNIYSLPGVISSNIYSKDGSLKKSWSHTLAKERDASVWQINSSLSLISLNHGTNLKDYLVDFKKENETYKAIEKEGDTIAVLSNLNLIVIENDQLKTIPLKKEYEEISFSSNKSASSKKSKKKIILYNKKEKEYLEINF